MNEHDLEYLREKLALLGEPELPPTLSAAALFRRMDEGSLTLPEEETPVEASPAWEGTVGEEPPEEALPAAGKDTEAAASPAGKVIPWRKVLQRGIPLAACLALVLMVYQGREVGLAKNFSSANQTAPGAPSSAAAAYDAAPESAEEGGSVLRSYQSYNAPAEISEDQQDQNTLTASGAPAPVPAPASTAEDSTGKTEKSAAEDPADDANPDIGGGEMAPMHPDSGGPETEPLHPDGGGPDLDLNPDVGGGDDPYSDAIRRRDKAIEAQALEIAAQYAPEEGVIPKLRGWGEYDDQIDFTIRYQDPEEHPIAQYHFYFRAEPVEGTDVPRLVLLSFHREEITTYKKK